MIRRDNYLNELITFKDQDLIKVITGIRRCGKSTLLEMYMEELKKEGIEDSQIIHLNLENPKYHFENYLDLYNFIHQQIKSKKKYYVFIDEVQNVKDFQKAVDGLYIDKKTDLYITGSNAYLLSGELATLLSGRYVEIKMLPLSFKEYLTAFPNDNKSKDEHLLDYMKYGGMPEVVNLFKVNPNAINNYLDGIFSTVVYKDIMARNNITDKLILESIIKYIFDNIGSSLSTKKISDTLTSMNRKTTNHTVENYLSAFIDSFLIYKVDRFDIRGKNHLASGYKYYTVDTGLRSYLLGKKASSDMGHILENIVYLELIRRGYKVYIGKNNSYEIDFVAENSDGLTYYQVALTTRTEETLNRELNSLQKIDDDYPKYILTMDRDLESDYNGIRKINVVDWLLQ